MIDAAADDDNNEDDDKNYDDDDDDDDDDSIDENDYYCIALYLSIYIAPLNSQRQTEAFLVRLAPRKKTSFKK